MTARLWLRFRQTLPPGPLFCVIDGPTAGRAWCAGDLRKQLHKLAALAGVRQRCAPHQLRHAMAAQALVDGVNILYLQRQLGHANLAITTRYLESLPQSRVIEELRKRPVPTVSALDLWNSPGVGDGRPRFERPATAPDLMGALAS